MTQVKWDDIRVGDVVAIRIHPQQVGHWRWLLVTGVGKFSKRDDHEEVELDLRYDDQFEYLEVQREYWQKHYRTDIGFGREYVMGVHLPCGGDRTCWIYPFVQVVEHRQNLVVRQVEDEINDEFMREMKEQREESIQQFRESIWPSLSSEEQDEIKKRAKSQTWEDLYSIYCEEYEYP